MGALDGHVVRGHHHLKGTRIKEIADQYAGFVTEHGIGGIAASAHVRVVDDIVMQQGGGMDEFDGGGEAGVHFTGVAGGTGCQQHQHRAQALAARIDDVVPQLVDQYHIGSQLLPYLGIDSGQVVAQQLSDVVQRHRIVQPASSQPAWEMREKRRC